MATNRTLDETDDARLNELYWYTGRTIEEIVRELGVNRNTVYTSIRPLQTGMSCSACGGQVVFTNRTKRVSGIGFCESCSSAADVAEFRADPSQLAPDAPESPEHHAPGSRRREHWREELVAVPRERAILIGGAAALGAIVGTLAVKAARR